MRLRKLLPLFIVFLLPFLGKAQVTTSSVTGKILTSEGSPLGGATIKATHISSGSVYSALSNDKGNFVIQGLRPGGPYKIEVTYVGYGPQSYQDITLSLGEAYNLNSTLTSEEKGLAEVTVTAASRSGASEKGGMSSVINVRQLNTLPTISRSITDFTRTTPQANGNNFGGRDARYNNITVDGANLNNNFGLSSDPLPGGGSNPISLDAIEAVSVSLAPYDVRQGNFTGANIAAVTKSGTNEFHGTAYTYWQNQGLAGNKVAGVPVPNPDYSSRIYGGSVGGPIIKNKLFFFVNGEYEKKPPQSSVAYNVGGSGNQSNVTKSDLDAVSQYVNQAFNYNPGTYSSFPAFKNSNHKILGKIDWNINAHNKLSVKYSDFKGTQDFQPSPSGNIGGVFSGATYGPRFSQNAMAYSGVLYQQQDIVRSGSLELNSNFNSGLANQFLATYTKVSTTKSHTGNTFPFVDILNDPTSSQNYISLGNEPFNANDNVVVNNILTLTDNVSYSVGQHYLTGGLSYEYQKVGNMFMPGSQGYYVYANVNDFINNAAPLRFAQTYSLIPGQESVYSAQLKIGQLSAYVQDEVRLNPKFKLSYGLRIDKPVFPDQPLENPAVTALTLDNINGDATHFTTGKWPKARILLSPRVSFKYDILGDQSLILRGGTGLFTGRIPYVYLTNIPTGSGMYQYTAVVDGSSKDANGKPVDMNDYKFNPDPHTYSPFYNTNLPSNLFPTKAGSAAPQTFTVIDPNYKFPQIWRTDLGIDKQFADGWKLTLEAMYTKDVNATYMYDANQGAPDAKINVGGNSERDFYSTPAARKINAAVTNAIVLASTSKGHSFVLTAQGSKSFKNGLYASFAYTYTNAKNITENPGNQAASVYSANVTANTLNDYQLSYSNFAVPHRIVGMLSYHVEYLKHLGTTVSLVYDGSSQGNYSYVYSGSVNNQGNNNANLMYVPKKPSDPSKGIDPSEVQFVDHVYKINGQNVTYTAAQQAVLFEQYIEQDPYLSKHRGKVVDRNGALYPWYNRLDMKFVQELFTNIGKNRNSIEFTVDLYNVLNFINNRWGVRQIYTIKNPLTVVSATANGTATYYITPYNNMPVTQTFINNLSTSTTWQMQLGLRYRF